MKTLRRLLMGESSLPIIETFEAVEWAPSGLLYRKVAVTLFWGFTIRSKPGPWTESVRRLE